MLPVPKVPLLCTVCGCKFTRWPSAVTNGRQVCSIDCRTALNRRDVASRLASRLLRVGDCLEFQGSRLKGYGRIGIGQKVEYAHRVAYALAHDVPLGKIGEWRIVHACDNPPCCEPKHLHVGTSETNAVDAALKGRMGHPHFLAHDSEALAKHMRMMGKARHGIYG